MSRSTVQSVVLDSLNNTLSLYNVTYIQIRNLGANDCELETQYGGKIFLPALGESIYVYAPIEDPLNEVWRAIFNFGVSKIHIIYTYHGKNK
ncbi:hypothetical protein EB118_13200 [bacterium]|nr:hypothetical protein [bacterium]NDD83713.1 hypothetical protein [bacterium]NDG31010.1 hypothetical protein [bacterium]